MKITMKKGRKLLELDVAHDKRGDWTLRFGAYRATWPATEPECDQWVSAGRPTEPVGPLPARVQRIVQETLKPSPWSVAGPLRFHIRSWAPLDGEESVSLYALRARDEQVVAANVWCTSPRCEVPGTNGSPARWSRVVIQFPGSSLDPRADRYPGFKLDGPVIEGRAPAEVVAEHKAWHLANFPPNGRVELDRWISRHRDVRVPEMSESERAEFDKNLSIARAERDGEPR